MLSGELHRRWPVNEAFKIIFVTSTAKKKKIPLYACKEVCLERDACVGPCIVVTMPRPHLKSEGHRASVSRSWEVPGLSVDLLIF